MQTYRGRNKRDKQRERERGARETNREREREEQKRQTERGSGQIWKPRSDATAMLGMVPSSRSTK